MVFANLALLYENCRPQGPFLYEELPRPVRQFLETFVSPPLFAFCRIVGMVAPAILNCCVYPLKFVGRTCGRLIQRTRMRKSSRMTAKQDTSKDELEALGDVASLYSRLSFRS